MLVLLPRPTSALGKRRTRVNFDVAFCVFPVYCVQVLVILWIVDKIPATQTSRLLDINRGRTVHQLKDAAACSIHIHELVGFLFFGASNLN